MRTKREERQSIRQLLASFTSAQYANYAFMEYGHQVAGIVSPIKQSAFVQQVIWAIESSNVDISSDDAF